LEWLQLSFILNNVFPHISPQWFHGMIKISVNQLDMGHVDCLEIFRKISFDYFSYFYEIDAKNDHFIVYQFYLSFLLWIRLIKRFSSFAEETIFYVDFGVFKEEFLESIHESLCLLFGSSWHVFELFKEKGSELIMRFESGSEGVDGLFFRLFLLKLLSFILNLFLFDHNFEGTKKMDWV